MPYMIPASAKRFFARLNATPKRRLTALFVVATVVGLTLVTALWLGPRWTLYSLDGTGLVVELPSAPRASRRGAAVPLFEAHTRHLAVVASGEALTTASRPDPAFLVQQAMADVVATPGVTDLDYRVGQERLAGRIGLVVAGTFLRHGVPSRLQGAFLVLPLHHGHVLCFWNDEKGALQARRVLQSVHAEGR